MRSETSNSHVLADYAADMRIAKYSPVTIAERLRILRALAESLDDGPLLAVTDEDLRKFQAGYSHLAPVTVDVYTRHVCAFYAWARKRRHITVDPAVDLDRPRIPRGRPHPTTPDQLRLIFACTTGALRIAYLLGAFAGLRCGEICRLQRHDLDLGAAQPTALVHGKGGHQRLVPLLRPVLDELYAQGLGRGSGSWVVTREGGVPYLPKQLSLESHHHLARLSIPTTLHSTRHFFATWAGRITKDPLFVRDLVGHQSVRTTEIYMQSTVDGAHDRLVGMCDVAASLLGLTPRVPS